MSNYPRDEFDAVEESSGRHGVHRTSMEPYKRSLMPLMIVGVMALSIGLLAFFILPMFLNAGTQPQSATTASTAPTTTPASQAPTQAPPTAPVATPTPTPTPEPTPESALDKSIPVAVFNATGIPGLAAQYAGLVAGNGWSVSQSANWAGQPQPASVIFYSDSGQRVNAEELGALLNIPTLVETAELALPLTVVLGPGA